MHTEATIQKIKENTKKALADPIVHQRMVTSHIGIKQSEETCTKKSEASIGEKNHFFGKKHTEESLLKMKIAHQNRSEEWKEKQRLSHQWQKGENHCCFGKSKPVSTRKKISETLKIVYQVKENHPRWMGGISLLPYCEKFNEPFKERVRAFFGYHCVKCGGPQTNEKLHVHHVRFNKSACCDETPRLFVALCRACHAKTNHNREYWEQYFAELIAIQYGGKCYFTENEMHNRGNAWR